MSYKIYKNEFNIAPFFECLDDDEIDINTFPFIDPILENNRDVVVDVVKYLKNNDTSHLDKYKNNESDKNIDLLMNIFNYLGCDEGYALKFLMNEDYLNSVKNRHLRIIQKYNQKLYSCFDATLRMFKYLGIYEKHIDYFDNKSYLKLFTNADTYENIYNYKVYDLDSYQSLKDNKPKNIVYLDYKYNGKIEKDVLFNNLINVIINNYNHPFENDVLPNSIKYLDIGRIYDKPFDINSLPDSLIELKLGECYNKPFLYSLPESLEKLIFVNKSKFNQKFEKGILPKSLTYLKLGDDYNQKFEKYVLPKSLKTLALYEDYNQKFEIGVLPESLTTLFLNGKYNIPFETNVLPKSLKTLSLYGNYNQPLDIGVLPESLETLNLGRSFNKPLRKNVLPKSLKSLYLDSNFNRPLRKGVLPESLEYLELRNTKYKYFIKKDVLPKSLKKLKIDYSLKKYSVINDDSIPPNTKVEFIKYKSYDSDDWCCSNEGCLCGGWKYKEKDIKVEIYDSDEEDLDEEPIEEPEVDSEEELTEEELTEEEIDDGGGSIYDYNYDSDF